jgi:uncharacterized protein
MSNYMSPIMAPVTTSDKNVETTTARRGPLRATLLTVVSIWTGVAYALPADDLYLAAGIANIKEVRRLLNEGVNPNAAVDTSGITALMQAASIGDKDIVKLLLDKGANVNARAGQIGITALMNAAAFGDVEMVRILVDKGAEINTKDTEGMTALSHAKVAKKEDIVNLLKTHGAKEKSEDQSSFTNPIVHKEIVNSKPHETMSGMESGKVIKGKVQRIEGDNYFVKNREDGKEVRLHVDKTTQTDALGIMTGDNVRANVNDQNQVMSILTDQKNGPSVQRDKSLKELEPR